MPANPLLIDLMWCVFVLLAVAIVWILAHWEYVGRARAPGIDHGREGSAMPLGVACATLGLVVLAVAASAAMGHYMRPLFTCAAGCEGHRDR